MYEAVDAIICFQDLFSLEKLSVDAHVQYVLTFNKKKQLGNLYSIHFELSVTFFIKTIWGEMRDQNVMYKELDWSYYEK